MEVAGEGGGSPGLQRSEDRGNALRLGHGLTDRFVSSLRTRAAPREPASGASYSSGGAIKRGTGAAGVTLAVAVSGALRGVPAERGAAHAVAAGGETSPTSKES